MVLRAGIILPFQYGDVKKLLMVGSPEEDRDLKLFDFTNVVRAAFNIYNFEFRNKQIDFQIPEELLVNYLEQCRDLTNFVIQIDQAVNNSLLAASSTQQANDHHHQQQQQQQQHHSGHNSGGSALSMESIYSQVKFSNYVQKSIIETNNFVATSLPRNNSIGATAGDLSSPLDVTTTSHHSDHSLSNNTIEPPIKMRRGPFYDDRTPESLTQSIDPNDVMPKTELDDTELNIKKEIQRQQLQQLQQQQQQPRQHQQTTEQLQLTPPPTSTLQQQTPTHFPFPNYGSTSLLTNPQIAAVAAAAAATSSIHSPQQHTTAATPPQMHIATNRFRRRGERMSKDQKELYVKFFEENPCMLQQRRNDAALAPLWNKLAGMLNNMQQGAVKNVEEWKQTFDAWRYRVFMYSRYNSKLTGDAAQNPKNYKPLTHTDQRAYAMWTSHRNAATAADYDKMDVFGELDETQPPDVYDY